MDNRKARSPVCKEGHFRTPFRLNLNVFSKHLSVWEVKQRVGQDCATMIRDIASYLGPFLEMAASILYVMATARGRVKPNRVSFAMFSFASFVAFAIQLSDGYQASSLLTLAAASGPLAILVVSFFKIDAYWKLTKFDFVCGALSVGALLAWLALRNSKLGITLAISCDMLATLPTLRKSWLAPDSEAAWLWWLSALAGAITAASVNPFTFVAAIFAIYLVLANGSIAVVTQVRKQPTVRSAK